MSDRRFRFAVQHERSPSGPAWIESARRVESLGYRTVQIMDHFGDQLAPVPAMAAAAVCTETQRIGSLVLNNDYRHPVVAAKELATLDVLSGGRLEVGLGAGWMISDYEESGIPHDRAGIRVDRLEEALAVYKGLWGDGPLTHEGEYYRITDHDLLPKPVQRPHPPILIGGGGRRVLSIAAREADIVGINPNLKGGTMASGAKDATADAVDIKIEIVREAAGDRWADIELHLLAFGSVVTDDRDATSEFLADRLRLTVDQVRESPYLLVGTTEQIADELRAHRDRWGFSYVTVLGSVMDAFAPVVAELSGT